MIQFYQVEHLEAGLSVFTIIPSRVLMTLDTHFCQSVLYS